MSSRSGESSPLLFVVWPVRGQIMLCLRVISDPRLHAQAVKGVSVIATCGNDREKEFRIACVLDLIGAVAADLLQGVPDIALCRLRHEKGHAVGPPELLVFIHAVSPR